MKRKIALFLSLVLMFCSLTACSSKPKEEKVEFSRGTVTDNIYTSTFAGIKFAAPEDWTLASEEELNAMMNVAIDNTDANALAKKYLELSTVYDMIAIAPDNSNVMIMYENLALTPGGTSYSETDYAEAVKGQMDSSYECGDTYTADLGGKTFTVMPASISGGQMFQDYYLLRVGNYMACIVFTSLSEPASSGMAEYFAAA